MASAPVVAAVVLLGMMCRAWGTVPACMCLAHRPPHIPRTAPAPASAAARHMRPHTARQKRMPPSPPARRARSHGRSATCIPRDMIAAQPAVPYPKRQAGYLVQSPRRHCVHCTCSWPSRCPCTRGRLAAAAGRRCELTRFCMRAAACPAVRVGRRITF